MRKYVLYAHDGSGNHGCEALVRTTAALLGGKEQVAVLSARPEEDFFYSVDDICEVVMPREGRRVPRWGKAFFRAYYDVRVKKDFARMEYLARICDAGVQPGDVAVSIGGDTYCYGFENRLAMNHRMWKLAGAKTVYWGCSIEPELLDNPNVAKDIRRYDLITARETISYHALKKINPNTVLVADSAFLLKKTEMPLPDGCENLDLVGINSSPLIEGSESVPGIARENYCKLVEKILNETKMGVLLIPHVVWKAVDDRTVLNEIYNRYKSSGRVFLAEDASCEVLKGYIARCRYFIGARTHATIAAYSSGVPTLVVGYSVKAKGIARDLFGSEEHYVLPVQQLQNPDDLAEAFVWLCRNEEEIRMQLKKMIPVMQKRALDGQKAIKKL